MQNNIERSLNSLLKELAHDPANRELFLRAVESFRECFSENKSFERLLELYLTWRDFLRRFPDMRLESKEAQDSFLAKVCYSSHYRTLTLTSG
jgi:hypothetical protein